ncbi:MAG: TIGR02587 family membrane protein [Chloroflexota bacterium]|jgi:putative integral membrane protein (TIGR02587 family)|nr:TIGR02587 family membrane protein [Chloroflexota bacterium]
MGMSGALRDGWEEEVDDLLRGLSGGFLLGIPLIYTMETWWLGETISMPRAIGFIGIAYLLNLAFVSVMGFRGNVPGSRHPAADALEATALAIVAASTILTLLHQIRPDSSLSLIIGRIAVGMVPISLGISVAHLILAPRESRTNGDEDGSTGGDSPEETMPPLVLDIGAAFAGALFLSISIAPTEEIPMLATEVPTLYLPLLILFSLALSYAVVFEAEFHGRDRRRETGGLFERPITETVLAYLVALLTTAGVLTLFGQIDVGTDPFVAFRYVIILGVPAAIGAAAGRLAV